MNTQLAANFIEGVFLCEIPFISEGDFYTDDLFLKALDSCGEETIYGLVSEMILEKIVSVYGIN